MGSVIATMSYLVLAAVTTAVLSYPTGPPNCDSVPNHSGGKGDEISLSLVDIGEGVWNVTVAVEHKGLILKADVDGVWEKPGRGYRSRSFGSGECITHSDRRRKGGNSFFFRWIQFPTSVLCRYCAMAMVRLWGETVNHWGLGHGLQ